MIIPLRNDKGFVLIDDIDYPFVKDFKWYLFKTANKQYASAQCRLINGKRIPLVSTSEIANLRRKYCHQRFNHKKVSLGRKTQFLMHRLILNPPKTKEIDHINGNGLDNRRINLRICTRLENGRHRKLSSLNTSGYHGVHYSDDGNRRKRWMAVIRMNKKKKYLGRFLTKKEAALAYNQAAIKYHGKFATLNSFS